MKTIICLLLLLAVVNLIPCQEYEQMIVFTLQGILKNLETINGKLGELHQELEHVKGVAEYNQGHLERLSQETVQSLRGDDFEHLTNLSAAGKFFSFSDSGS
ncbi:uncharacterized protein [Palaemon carinicauda]|uniref:uncharacterized protein n=1 Tax=Palaemon carinicauda TaxID=392227 RepID=UPI0035B57D9C